VFNGTGNYICLTATVVLSYEYLWNLLPLELLLRISLQKCRRCHIQAFQGFVGKEDWDLYLWKLCSLPPKGKWKIKVKCLCLINHYTLKTYGELSAFHNLGTGWRLVVSFMPQERKLLLPLDWRQHGPQSRSKCCNVFCSALNVITVLSQLSWLYLKANRQ
jgi:hypothetical protein